MLIGAGFVAGLVLECLTLQGSRRLALLAHPNERSFHVRPTPTAGGLAFVLPVAGYLAWLGSLGAAPALALAAGGLALAAVGLWDDLREASARLRLLLHVAAAAVFVWSAWPEAGWVMGALVVLALAWHINLYNFMDGIDGLAGVQGLVFFVGVQVAGMGLPGWPGDLCWLAAGALVAFLAYNWPPARIFMGDTGSGFLGLVTGGMALLLWREQTLPLTASLVLLAGFWFDASYTLIVRASTGQAITQAHRSHLYQKVAAKRGHLWTTTCYLLYGVFWLLPLAWLCARSALPFPLILVWLVPAVAPLAAAAWWLRAGLPDACEPFSPGAHERDD